MGTEKDSKVTSYGTVKTLVTPQVIIRDFDDVLGKYWVALSSHDYNGWQQWQPLFYAIIIFCENLLQNKMSDAS